METCFPQLLLFSPHFTDLLPGGWLWSSGHVWWGCLSACLIQQQHKGPATVVCTFEPLKAASADFCGFQGKGVHSEVRGGSLQCENNTELWFRLQTRCLAWISLIVVVLYVWKELRPAVLFCLCVLVCRGTCSWSNFRVKQKMKEGKALAGEMWHNDKMVLMMKNHAMAPMGDVYVFWKGNIQRRVISSDRHKHRATGWIRIQVDTLW